MNRRRFPHAPAGLALLAMAAGCSTVPAPVVSPGIRAPLGVGGTWSTDWGFARARVRRPDGTIQTVATNGDNIYGQDAVDRTALAFFIAAALSAHEVAGEWDAGEYVGWRRFGLTLRRRLLVTAGGAMTSLAAAGNAAWSLRALDGSLALEQTVPLPGESMLLLRLGGGYGLRDYVVALPADLDAAPHLDDPSGSGARWDLRRVDARIEPLVGVVFPRGAVVLSLQPYFVVAHQPLRDARCVECLDGVALLDFTQRWGLAVALTVRSP